MKILPWTNFQGLFAQLLMKKEIKRLVVSTPGLPSDAGWLASQASGWVCSIIISIVAAEIS